MKSKHKIVKYLKVKFKLWRIYFTYRKRISFEKNDEKEIIIMFDGLFSHGGLVDRLKGIISFYQISIILGAKFKIYFKHPFELKEFLESNVNGLYANEDNIKWNPLNTSFLYLMDNPNFDPFNFIKNSSKKKFIIYCNIDYTEKLSKYFNNESEHLSWGWYFGKLFRMSELLKSTLASFKLEESRISIHTRFTSLLGDFSDSSKKKIDNDRRKKIFSTLINSIDEISRRNEGKSIYLFSDSIQFLQYASKNCDCKILEGIPTHIDIQSVNSNLENHTKTFIDFFAMSGGNEVNLLKTKEMYNSAFSLYASKIKNIPFKTIEL